MIEINIVKPILDDEIVKEIEEHFKIENERDYILFIIGTRLGLRVSDILKLRVKDVFNKNTIEVIEKKTGKKKEIEISNKLKRDISKFCKDKRSMEYLIKSRKGYNKPIKRDRAYRIIKDMSELFGLEHIGTHSMRKTFGRKYYEKYGDVEELRKYFNHSSTDVTRRYIGLEQEVINKKVKELWD